MRRRKIVSGTPYPAYSPQEIAALRRIKYPNVALARWLSTLDAIMDEFSEAIRQVTAPKEEEPVVKE